MTAYPLELNNRQHANGLFQVLKNTSERRVWPVGKAIVADDGNFYILPNRIIAVDGDVTGEVIYKALSNNIFASTSVTSIYEVQCSFKFSRTGGLRFLDYPPQVVKLMAKFAGVSHADFADFVKTEYLHSKDMRHLGVHKPILLKNHALLLMNKMPGIELFSFIKKLLDEEINLTAAFLFMLTEALLKAFEEQVMAYSISHQDLKPENILLNTDYGDNLLEVSKYDLERYIPQHVEANIVDYAHARKYGGVTFNDGGTLGYISPEHADKVFVDEKPDLYALAIILQIIWGLFRYSIKAKVVANGERLLEQETLESLYSFKYKHQQESISYATFLRICMLTINLVATSPEQRWNFQQAKTAYLNIVNAPHNDVEHNVVERRLLYNEEADAEVAQAINSETAGSGEMRGVNYPLGLLGVIQLVSNIVFDLVVNRIGSIVNFIFAPSEGVTYAENEQTYTRRRYFVPFNSLVSFTNYSPRFRAKLDTEITKLQAVADGLAFFNYVDAGLVEYDDVDEESVMTEDNIDNWALRMV